MDNLLSINKVKTSIQTRVEAYNLMKELKEKGILRKEILELVTKKYGISKRRIYDWYAGRDTPWLLRDRGEFLEFKKELFYILGALFGDGCIYYWKGIYQVKIYGEKEFISKCATKLSLCLKKKINGYFYKSYFNKHGTDLWYIQTGHKKLFNLFKSVRTNFDEVLDLIKEGDYKENSLHFIEGFFDAEGCVKIIKEPVRIIPKICLDICCTNFEVLELVRKLLLEHLGIEARYSIQEPKPIWKSNNKKTVYHLRIYRKEYIRKFLENINTTKLKSEKINYVKNWFNNKDKKEIVTLYHS